MAASRVLAAALLVSLVAPGIGAQVWWEKPPADGKKVDRLAVDAAITIGAEHIKSKQRLNGSFPGHDDAYPTGMTALCLLTMIKCGAWGSNEETCFSLLFLRRSHLSIDREIRTEAVVERRAEIGRRPAEWAARA